MSGHPGYLAEALSREMSDAHLWWERTRRDFSDVHAGLFTDDYIRSVDTTYNRLARPYLPELDLW